MSSRSRTMETLVGKVYCESLVAVNRLSRLLDSDHIEESERTSFVLESCGIVVSDEIRI